MRGTGSEDELLKVAAAGASVAAITAAADTAEAETPPAPEGVEGDGTPTEKRRRRGRGRGRRSAGDAQNAAANEDNESAQSAAEDNATEAVSEDAAGPAAAVAVLAQAEATQTETAEAAEASAQVHDAEASAAALAMPDVGAAAVTEAAEATPAAPLPVAAGEVETVPVRAAEASEAPSAPLPVAAAAADAEPEAEREPTTVAQLDAVQPDAALAQAEPAAEGDAAEPQPTDSETVVVEAAEADTSASVAATEATSVITEAEVVEAEATAIERIEAAPSAQLAPDTGAEIAHTPVSAPANPEQQPAPAASAAASAEDTAGGLIKIETDPDKAVQFGTGAVGADRTPRSQAAPGGSGRRGAAAAGRNAEVTRPRAQAKKGHSLTDGLFFASAPEAPLGINGRAAPRLTSAARLGVLDQATHTVLAHVEHQIETPWPTVIRIGHLGLVAARCREVHEQPQLRPIHLRTLALHDVEVPAVHRQQQVEFLKIAQFQLARTQAGEVVPALAGELLRARVRRLADVITVRPGRIHLDQAVQAPRLEEMPRHALGGRRPADISRAHKEHLLHASPLSLLVVQTLPCWSAPNARWRSLNSSSRAAAAFSNSRLRACSCISFSRRLIARASAFSSIVA